MVRMSRNAKSHLRRLQEAWRKVWGDEPAQEEMLEMGPEFLDRHLQEFVPEASWRPFMTAELRALKKRQGHYGNWSVRDLDEAVYGDSP